MDSPRVKGIATAGFDQIKQSFLLPKHRWSRYIGETGPLDQARPEVEALAMRLKMPSLIEILVIVAIVAVLIALILPGPFHDHDFSHRYPSLAVHGVDLARVAGEYYQGDGRRNWHLSILPDGRYSFFSTVHGGVLHREAGQAREVDGHIVLTPEKANPYKMPRKMIPVRWDKRFYFLRPDGLPRFCEEILTGSEPRNGPAGNTYLSNLDRADGLPDVPEEWLAKLRAQLTVGKIIEAGEKGTWARVALGRRQGLKVGDLLMVQGHRVRGLQVKSVVQDSCLVRVMHPDENNRLKIGQNIIIPQPVILAPE
jgi:hypothetical protein